MKHPQQVVQSPTEHPSPSETFGGQLDRLHRSALAT